MEFVGADRHVARKIAIDLIKVVVGHPRAFCPRKSSLIGLLWGGILVRGRPLHDRGMAHRND